MTRLGLARAPAAFEAEHQPDAECEGEAGQQLIRLHTGTPSQQLGARCVKRCRRLFVRVPLQQENIERSIGRCPALFFHAVA
jgi:hypothetical protein